MIKTLHIKNFKSIQDEKFDFKPLTLLTGTNSSGKSSVLQTLNMFISANNDSAKAVYIKKFTDSLYKFDEIRNKKLNQNSIDISLNDDNFIKIQKDNIERSIKENIIFEENFYYLSANRDVIKNNELEQLDIKFGINGENVSSYFNSHSFDTISDFFVSKEESKTLGYYLDIWTKEILDLDFRFSTIKNSDLIISRYIQKGFENSAFLPSNVATGVNFITKILIVGLSLKKGDIFVVENPEIHLHPRAISKLTEFFAFLVSNDIQVIIETHSNYLISKLRYLVFKKKLKHNDIIIYYKDFSKENFERVYINKNGVFSDEERKKRSFPSGFLDMDLAELMEIR